LKLNNKGLYGWAVVAGAFISHFLSYGTLVVAFGIFFPFMAESLGWGRGLLASATVVSRATAALVGPFMGHSVDKRGPRIFVFLGGIALAAGAGLLALVHSPWQLFVAYGVVLALGAVALGDLTADSTVSKWFIRRRGRAIALTTMGMSSAGIALHIPLAFIIVQIGWREAWVAVAVVIVVLTVLAAPLMRRRPEDYGLVPDGLTSQREDEMAPLPAEVSLTRNEAIRTPSFWLLAASTNLASLAIFGINLHMFSYITDKGMSIGLAASAITYLYLLQTLAKPLWGFVAERLPVRYCLTLCYAGGALGIVILIGASSPVGLFAFATVYGLTRGAQSFVSSLAWSNYFGRESQAAIRGTLFPFRFVSGSGGPVLAGLMFDLQGDYILAFSVFVLAFALGSFAAFIARPPRMASAAIPD
jgi:MFS family permease